MDQDIIEKRPSSPMGTSLLAIAAACMIAGMVMAGAELRELKYGEREATASADAFAKKETQAYKSAISSRPKPEMDDE